MSKFVTKSFWFQLNPELSYVFINSLFVIALVFLAIALFGHMRQKEKTIFRAGWRSVFSFGIGNFFLYLLWWVFAFEAVPLLSMRIWFAIFVLMDLAWLKMISKKFKRRDINSAELEAKKIIKKYIP